MEQKTFRARTLREALSEMKDALGEDAYVVSTRRVERKSFLPLFRKKCFEITASKKGSVGNIRVKTAGGTPEGIYPGLRFPEVSRPFYEQLIDAEMDRVMAKSLVSVFELKLPLTSTAEQTACLREGVLGHVATCLKTNKEKPVSSSIAAFVGPTGSGKTTTLVKWASREYLFNKKDVVVIIIDVFKIGGIEQLKLYSGILKIPMEVAYTPGDLKNLLEKHKDRDMIFIDTQGTSQYNKKEIHRIMEFIDDSRISKVLLLPAQIKAAEMYNLWQSYQDCNPECMIITKLDEVEKCGGLIQLLWDTRIPVAFVTNGQKVPEDILQPDSRQLAEILLGI